MNGSDRTIVPVDMGAGQTILVEARADSDPEQDVGIRDVFSFDGVEESITAIAARVTSAVRAAAPDRIGVEFGIDVSLESGALAGMLVKGSGEANLKITLQWGPAATDG